MHIVDSRTKRSRIPRTHFASSQYAKAWAIEELNERKLVRTVNQETLKDMYDEIEIMSFALHRPNEMAFGKNIVSQP